MIYNPKNNIEVELKKLTAYPAVESASIINDKWPNNYFAFIDKLGDIYFKDKKFLDASVCYKLTLESPTIMKEIYFKLANTLFLHGNYEESYYYAKKMYGLFPCNIDYTRLYIEIILIIGEVQEIDNLSKKLFEKNPKNDDYKFFLAQSKRLLGDFSGSRKLLEQLENDTNNIKYSFALADTIGEVDTLTAINCYEKIISKGAKISAIQKFNLSIHYLRSRNFKKGWEYFEFGLDKTIGKRGRKLPYNFKGTYRISNDEEINKKDKILVCSEQGIGDQILFYSVLNDAINEHINLFIICEERMETILKRSFPLISFSSNGNFINSDLKQMLSNGQLAYFPLATLYSRYRPNIDKIINRNKSYIIPNATLKAQFRTHLDCIAKGRKIIGICWKSFVDNNISIVKNIDFLNWLTLFTNENLIVNLQYGNSLDEQQLLNNLNLEMISFNEIDFKQDLDSWLSLSCACDGVISVSSSIVHFAGSTGQKVSVVMPFNQGHWSLGLSDKESIFYPNVRIFRVGDRITETSIILDAYSYIQG
jgi:tetratricopeptide (TPR) repeat protein